MQISILSSKFSEIFFHLVELAGQSFTFSQSSLVLFNLSVLSFNNTVKFINFSSNQLNFIFIIIQSRNKFIKFSLMIFIFTSKLLWSLLLLLKNLNPRIKLGKSWFILEYSFIKLVCFICSSFKSCNLSLVWFKFKLVFVDDIGSLYQLVWFWFQCWIKSLSFLHYYGNTIFILCNLPADVFHLLDLPILSIESSFKIFFLFHFSF